MKIKITDRKFLKFVKNTKNDLVQNSSQDEETISYLREIINKKEITIISVQSLYMIIETRKEHLNYIKMIQDKESFNIINKEHKYMETFINRYFNYKPCDITGLEIITIKGYENV